MRKRNKGRKLSRPDHQRKALLKALATALFTHGKITTTEAKAKELRPVAEKCITRAKIDTVTNKRVLGAFLTGKVVTKLVGEIAPQYKERRGGYTRIVKLGQRKSDGSRMAIIELVK